VSNHWNRNPFDSILPAEISNVKGVYPIDMIALTRPAGPKFARNLMLLREAPAARTLYDRTRSR
jgi:hypothetical protein